MGAIGSRGCLRELEVGLLVLLAIAISMLISCSYPVHLPAIECIAAPTHPSNSSTISWARSYHPSSPALPS